MIPKLMMRHLIIPVQRATIERKDIQPKGIAAQNTIREAIQSGRAAEKQAKNTAATDQQLTAPEHRGPGR